MAVGEAATDTKSAQGNSEQSEQSLQVLQQEQERKMQKLLLALSYFSLEQQAFFLRDLRNDSFTQVC